MSNSDTTVTFEQQKQLFFRANKPSIMTQLAQALFAEGIQVKVIKKTKNA